jgi:hypothetical protein
LIIADGHEIQLHDIDVKAVFDKVLGLPDVIKDNLAKMQSQ